MKLDLDEEEKIKAKAHKAYYKEYEKIQIKKAQLKARQESYKKPGWLIIISWGHKKVKGLFKWIYDLK